MKRLILDTGYAKELREKFDPQTAQRRDEAAEEPGPLHTRDPEQ